MDRTEAENILQLYRPNNIEDRNDPLMTEALELLDHDTELKAWFEEQQALDAKISTELSSIEPPADLKNAILMGMRAHQAEQCANPQDSTDDQVTPFPTANRTEQKSWLKPWMGIAALFIAAFVVLVLPRAQQSAQLAQSDQNATASAVPDVINFLASEMAVWEHDRLDKEGNDFNELKAFLASTGNPRPASLPSILEGEPTLGCYTFDYDDTKLTMICFKSDKVYHLITADKASFPKDSLPQGADSSLYECKDQAFKVWSSADQVFILTTEGTAEAIPDFI
jgi:hypothetical protein